MRPEVLTFATFMETVLRQNDKKGGWDSMSYHDLFMRVCDELTELAEEIDKGDKSFIMKEALDAGNFLMMIFNKALKDIWSRR